MIKLELDFEEIVERLQRQKTEEINIMEFIIILFGVLSQEEKDEFTRKMGEIKCPEDKFALIEEYRHYIMPNNQMN